MASVRSHLLNAAIRITSKCRLAGLHFTPAAIAATRERLERFADRKPLSNELTRAQRSLGDVPTEWTHTVKESRGVIFYCHGGAYAVGSPKVYRGLAARLATRTGCGVAVIDYRLAPEHPYPAAPDDAIGAYEALLDEVDARSVVFAGDSAGGNLALVTLLRARERGLPLPAAAVLLSPWTDLTGSGASVLANRKRDPMLPAHRLEDAARLYAGAAELDHPDVSPLFADLAGLPALAIHVGSTEVLLDDSHRLAARAREHGVDVELTTWHRMPHVFPMFADFIPEARLAIDAIAAFVATRLGSSE